MSTATRIEWTEILCTNRLQRKPFLARILLTVSELVGGWS
jgi:hypothetical protein